MSIFEINVYRKFIERYFHRFSLFINAGTNKMVRMSNLQMSVDVYIDVK